MKEIIGISETDLMTKLRAEIFLRGYKNIPAFTKSDVFESFEKKVTPKTASQILFGHSQNKEWLAECVFRILGFTTIERVVTYRINERCVSVVKNQFSNFTTYDKVEEVETLITYNLLN